MLNFPQIQRTYETRLRTVGGIRWNRQIDNRVRVPDFESEIEESSQASPQAKVPSRSEAVSFSQAEDGGAQAVAAASSRRRKKISGDWKPPLRKLKPLRERIAEIQQSLTGT